jgi:hypothetical protein
VEWHVNGVQILVHSQAEFEAVAAAFVGGAMPPEPVA